MGANNTPNMPLKLMYFFVFEATDLQSTDVKLTEILFCIKFQLWTIYFETITMSKINLSTFRGTFRRRGLGKKIVHDFQRNPQRLLLKT